MKPRLKAAFEREMQLAQVQLQRNALDAAFDHLRRAHILSQRHTGAHVRVHRAMLRLGWRRRDARELLGQLTRILAAAIFSSIWVPAGNTGSADVSAFRPMPLPADLRALLAEDEA